MAEETALPETPEKNHNGLEFAAPPQANAALPMEELVHEEVRADVAADEPIVADLEATASPAAEAEAPAETKTPEVPAQEPHDEAPAPALEPAAKPAAEKKPRAAGRKPKSKPEPQEAPAPEAATAAPEAAMPVPAGEEKPAEETKKWYVVKVQSGREESIKEAIERRVKIEGLEEYFGEILIPVEKEKVLVRGKRIERERKLFPGYIMAKVDFNDQILYLFRETSGVGDFVGGGPNTKPLPMTELEVARMTGKKFIQDRPVGKTTGAAPFSMGERVKIKEGVFSDMEGDVKEVLEAKEKVRVEVFVMGRPVSVELDYWEVELV